MKNLIRICHQIAKEKGFWKGRQNQGEKIALMHSELSECLEELRKPVPNRNQVVEELADCVIRIFDFCEAYGYDLETAMWEKIDKNKKRPKKHGKRF